MRDEAVTDEVVIGFDLKVDDLSFAYFRDVGDSIIDDSPVERGDLQAAFDRVFDRIPAVLGLKAVIG